MKKDEIKSLAIQAGFEFNFLSATYTNFRLLELLNCFANLVAKAEREECKKLGDEDIFFQKLFDACSQNVQPSEDSAIAAGIAIGVYQKAILLRGKIEDC